MLVAVFVGSDINTAMLNVPALSSAVCAALAKDTTGTESASKIVPAPDAQILSSIDSVLSPLATATSTLPSVFTSTAATATGDLPVANTVWDAKLVVLAPRTVVFTRTDAVLLL